MPDRLRATLKGVHMALLPHINPALVMQVLMFSTAAAFGGARVCAAGVEPVRLFSSLNSLTYAENFSIDAWINDWQTTDRAAGDTALTRNGAEFGAAYGQMSVAVFSRRDYYLHFSQDTFDLVYQDKNTIPFDTTRRYEIHLDVAHVQISGLKIGYDITPMNRLKSRVEFNFFDAQEVLFGDLNGFLAMPDGKITGDLALNYNYTEDVVLARPKTPAATGRGQSVDVEIWWQPVGAVKLHVLAEDIYSQIKWSQTPYTEAVITTVRTSTQSDGSVRRLPTISGREYFRAITQTIPRHFMADIGYEILPAWQIALSQERIDTRAFNRVMALYSMGQQATIGLGYDTTAQAPRLEFNGGRVNVVASADSTDSRKAKFIAVSAGLRVQF